MNFNIDDIVRLKTGKSPQIVREFSVTNRQIRCEYLSSLGYNQTYGNEVNIRRWRSVDDYVHVYETQPEPEEAPAMSDLYQTKEETPRFGIKIATNSAGQAVLEMKGEGGKVEAFPQEAIELVLPYTVSLILLGNHVRGESNNLHVIAEKGQVNKDDVLIEVNSGLMWRVQDVDTKIKSPKENKSKWLRIPAEKLTFGDDK